MNECRKIFHMGKAYGMLYGISLRADAPLDIREVCAEAVKKYKDELNKKGEQNGNHLSN